MFFARNVKQRFPSPGKAASITLIHSSSVWIMTKLAIHEQFCAASACTQSFRLERHHRRINVVKQKQCRHSRTMTSWMPSTTCSFYKLRFLFSRIARDAFATSIGVFTDALAELFQTGRKNRPDCAMSGAGQSEEFRNSSEKRWWLRSTDGETWQPGALITCLQLAHRQFCEDLIR